MMKVLRNGQRHHVQHGKHERWHSILAEDRERPLDSGFGFLLAFDELCLQPGASTQPRCEDETEIVTYVYKGALSQQDREGNLGVLHTGEFQRLSTGRRTRLKETSVSRTDSVHLFRMSLRSDQAGLDRGYEQKRFTQAERHNRLCVVGSPDGRSGSMGIHQEVLVCSAILDSGQHLVHELEPGRTGWLHAVRGAFTINDTVLTQGDAAGITNQRTVSLTAHEGTELLLVDSGPTHLRPWERSHRRKERPERRGAD